MEWILGDGNRLGVFIKGIRARRSDSKGLGFGSRD